MKRKHLSIFIIVTIVCLALVSTTYAANVRTSFQKVKSAISGPTQMKPKVANSVIINGDGTVRIFGTIVLSTGGNTILTQSEINGKFVQFEINTDATTKILTANPNTSVGGISAGSIIMITGIFQNFSPDLTVLATEIRVRGGSTEVVVPVAPIVETNASSTDSVLNATSTATTTEPAIESSTMQATVDTGNATTSDLAPAIKENVETSTTSDTISTGVEATSTPGVIETIVKSVSEAVSDTIQNIIDIVNPDPTPAPAPTVETPAVTEASQASTQETTAPAVAPAPETTVSEPAPVQ